MQKKYVLGCHPDRTETLSVMEKWHLWARSTSCSYPIVIGNETQITEPKQAKLPPAYSFFFIYHQIPDVLY